MKVYVLTKQVFGDNCRYNPDAGLFKGVFGSIESAKDAFKMYHSDIEESRDYDRFWEQVDSRVWRFPEGRVGRWHIYERTVAK